MYLPGKKCSQKCCNSHKCQRMPKYKPALTFYQLSYFCLLGWLCQWIGEDLLRTEVFIEVNHSGKQSHSFKRSSVQFSISFFHFCEILLFEYDILIFVFLLLLRVRLSTHLAHLFYLNQVVIKQRSIFNNIINSNIIFFIFSEMSNQNTHQPLLHEQKYKSLGYLIKLALNCGLSAFYYGYTLTFFNSVSFANIIIIFDLEGYPRALTQGLLTGSVCFTGAIGSILSTQLISRFSRRQCLMILNVIALILTLLSLISSIYSLVLVRLCQGLVIGSISCLTPLYMRETMPKQVSGPLWSLHQVAFVLGMSSGFILTYILSLFTDPVGSWRIIFGFPLVTSTLHLIIFTFFIKFDTPKWYVLAGREAEARQALTHIYKPEYVDKVLQEIKQAHSYTTKNHLEERKSNISEALSAEYQMQKLGISPDVDKEQQMIQLNHKNKAASVNKATNNPLAVFLAILFVIQQPLVGGIVVVQYGGEMTLKTYPSLQTSFPVIINLLGLCGSILSIQVMRKWGRKQILTNASLLISFSLLIGYLIFRTFSFHNIQQNPAILRIVLLIDFLSIRLIVSLALGPLPWLYIAEILQPNLIPFCFLLNWIAIGAVSTMFPIICEWDGGNPALAFLIFFSYAFAVFIIGRKLLVETKNRTELEIRKQFDEKCKNY